MQILTAMIYGIPMPVQPLKAVAMIVISQKVASNIIYGGGLAIGIFMLLLSITGLIDLLAKYTPKVVIRGIQFGLGMNLILIALKEYIPSESVSGYTLAIISFVVSLILLGNRKYPPAIFIILLGIIYALSFNVKDFSFLNQITLSVPKIYIPVWNDIILGFVLLALPQIPLSLGNSIFATKQIANDFSQKKMLLFVK
jgi:xanthine/uracil/vitamin C permease (AzgA family)